MGLELIKNSIKNEKISSLYLFYGEEEYLKDYYFKLLKDKIVDKGFEDFNYSAFVGSGIDYISAWDAAEALPFMSEHKLILIKNSGILKAPKVLEKEFWESKLEDVPSQTSIVFYEKEIDKRSKLYKLINKKGLVFEFEMQKTVDLANWANRVIASYNKKMLKEDLFYLLEHCDLGMHSVKNEIDKLVNYSGDKEIISRADIDELCIKSAESRVFQMIDALMERRVELAIGLLNEMIILKEPVVKILTLISRYFSSVYKVKLMLNRGSASSEIAKNIGVAPFIANKYITQARRFSIDFLKGVMQECLDLDVKLKSSSIDNRIALETFVIQAALKK